MDIDTLEKINSIRKGELVTAIDSAKTVLHMLEKYQESNFDDSVLREYASFYFKCVAILQNAMIRFGMCDYLLGVEKD